MTFTVAIVGRPNVGKSTLFNRLARRKLALVDDQPGMTRDRRIAEASFGDMSFDIIDTAGLEDGETNELSQQMWSQTELGIDEADVVLFVIDAREGVTPVDETLANWTRRKGKPTILVANKCEGSQGLGGVGESYGLGLGDPIALSAEHGEGMGDLYHTIAELVGFESAAEGVVAEEENSPFIQLAIVGRPNVGKSTLVNKLMGADRVLTGAEAGVTRDSIALDWEYDGKRIKLFDTAGMRKSTKIHERPEKLSVFDTRRAIQYAQVAVVVMDAQHVSDEGRAMVIALNKWDLVKNKSAVLKEFSLRIGEVLSQVKGLLFVPISAKNDVKYDKMMQAVFTAYSNWNKRVSTADLNRWLDLVTQEHPLPLIKGRRLKIRYMTQIKTRPPTFSLFVSRAEVPGSYERYLVNRLREDFDIVGVPIRFHMRTGKNPYV